ncbi:hypothetical protein [Streptomyces javensis]|uniref:Transposase n=1 Tax=Streptomyces javensis TaxID=114698 RepID=A0ABS0R740_9ACTN|nr:hypothetical protein [Streptomyces javensis]MBI0312819.1 hypothetical protein [Streptomyces javensis]
MPLGYTSSYQRVHAYLRTKRLSTDPVTAPPPSPHTVSGWILSPPDAITEVEQLRKAVLSRCPELDALAGHAGRSPRCSPSAKGQRLP